mgnify:CR=1 FL=1
MNDLPRYERLLSLFLSGRQRDKPDKRLNAKEVRKDEGKHSDYVKRVRGICK